MKIENIKVGRLECNCYILSLDNYVLVVDPGDDYEKIKKVIGNRKILGILITHNHFDHVGALNNILKDYETEVYDISNLKEKKYILNKFEFKVIYTKGHTEDSITYYFYKNNIMFTGDFLFKDSIGRCDLPTGNVEDMKKSINKIKKYSDNIKIYPGHGEETSLGYEKRNNYYFNYNW